MVMFSFHWLLWGWVPQRRTLWDWWSR